MQTKNGDQMQKTLKIAAYVVLALMAAGVLYANGIGIMYWTGIGV